MRNSIISLDEEKVQIEIEVIIVRVSIMNEDLCNRGQTFTSTFIEQFMIREFMRPSFEGSVNIDMSMKMIT